MTTENRSEDIKDSFHEALQHILLVLDIPHANFVGNFNAK
jgi:hypothetical protein